MTFDNSRPWPRPAYKAIFRVIYAALILWILFPPLWVGSYVSVALLLGIWGFLEWVWLNHYNNWLRSRAVDSFFEAAQAGSVFTECPKCGEQGIELRDFLHHHLRLMHPDVDPENMAPHVALAVPKPPLWVRLW